MFDKFFENITNTISFQSNNSTIKINGKEYKGKNINIINGKVVVDGKEQDEIKEQKIEIHGDVTNLDACDVTVYGNIHGKIDSTNAIITGNVNGDIEGTNVTVNGDVTGDVDGVNVKIRKKNERTN